MNVRVFPAIAVLVIVTVSMVPLQTSCADPGTDILVDYGNGSYEWAHGSGSTYAEVLVSTGLDCSVSPMTIRGQSDGPNASWHLFSWDGTGWVPEGIDVSRQVTGGYAAFAFYPDGFAPVVTPEHRNAWMQLGGSSGSTGVSQSSGPSDPRLPVEWYRTYTTGFVDSGLVVAGDLLYHTTGGTYGATGPDADPRVYCLDRLTGDIMWEYRGTIGAGYEVTTPVIVDSHLVVSMTDGDLLVFDRFTGEIEDSVTIPFQPPLDPDGNIDWDGRVFVTGATTPVYDSGALYFGTADGRVMCYSLSPAGSLSEVWTYEPPVGVRGCFYYHAPTMADVDGTRMLFIGSYEGFLHALDASTGDPVWVERVVDMREYNTVKGSPGSASTVTVSPDGSRLIVVCTDSAMIPENGYALFLDPRTGKALDRDGSDMRLDALMTKPVPTEGGFYTYVTPVSSGGNGFTYADGTDAPVTNAIYMFDWDGNVVWMSREYQSIKAQLTLSDGILYAMDYSAGSMWPTGGGITAVDADNGDELWRLLLRPCTDTSFSMVQVTVIDGKLYAANDLGAVYCLSDTPGQGTEEERIEVLQTQGFRHWSWVLLSVITVAAMAVAIRFY